MNDDSNSSIDYAVVFSGGGALGAWEVGCYKAIYQKHGDRKPTIVTGASAGALNAAAICAGLDITQLENLWKKLQPRDVFSKEPGFLPTDSAKLIWKFTTKTKRGNDSIYKTDPLRRYLSEAFDDSRVEAFRRNREMSCVISSTNLTRGQRILHYQIPPGESLPQNRHERKYHWQPITNKDELISALMGTTALPLLFPPNEEHLFDGGVLHNQPISPVLILEKRLRTYEYQPIASENASETAKARRIYVLIPSTISPGRIDNLQSLGNSLLTVWLTSTAFPK